MRDNMIIQVQYERSLGNVQITEITVRHDTNDVLLALTQTLHVCEGITSIPIKQIIIRIKE